MMAILNTEQKAALDAVAGGSSLFLTGAGGTGKTFTLKRIIQWAHDVGKRIGVTALTGTAAMLLSGRTLHSFLGIGLGTKKAEVLAYTTLSKYKPLADKLARLDVLLIDEISMADKDLLNLISDYLSIVRQCDVPFGGLQMVFSGDFCQLPPVDGAYCFHARAWKELSPKVVCLTTQIRQDGDPKFQAILERARFGAVTPDDIALLQSLRDTEFPDNIVPTRLYARRCDVDAINRAELKKISDHSATTTYVAEHLGKNKAATKAWAASYGIPEQLQLAAGAQVLLTVNLSAEEGLMNGSRGYVVALEPKRAFVQWVRSGLSSWVTLHSIDHIDQPGTTVRFMPLKLAWAITIHKSQGMTLDAVEMDIGDSIFEYGQAYTALSRARNLQSIRLVKFAPSAFKTHPHVVKFYQKI